MSFTTAIETADGFGPCEEWGTVTVEGPTTAKTLIAIQDGKKVTDEAMQTMLATLLYSCSSEELTNVFNVLVQPDEPVTLKYERDDGDRTGIIIVK